MKGIPFKAYADASVFTNAVGSRPLFQQLLKLIQFKAFDINSINRKLRNGWLKKLSPLHIPLTSAAKFTDIVTDVKYGDSRYKVDDQVYSHALNRYAA